MDRRAVFGKQVRALREARGYSQEDLADLARLHRTYVGGVERGERNVSLLNIWCIADALGVDPSALFPALERAGDDSRQRISGSSSEASPKQTQGGKWTKRRKA
ncbi:MAG: helix-turn-helix domain-containing protein [Acidobacteriaceae bacterium]